MLADDSFVRDGVGTGQRARELHVTSRRADGPTHAMQPVAIRMLLRSTRVVSMCLLFVTLVRGTASAAASVIAGSGDASIVHDEAAGTWRLFAGGATLTIAADAARDFAVMSLLSSSGRAWTVGSASDSFVRVSGRTLAFGSRAAGFEFKSADVVGRGKGFELRVGYALPAASLALTRHYAVVSGSPTFEAWTTFSPAGGTPPIADLNALLLTLPNGTIHWVTGLRGDAADVAS